MLHGVCEINTLEPILNQQNHVMRVGLWSVPILGSLHKFRTWPWRMLPRHRCLASSSMCLRCPLGAILIYQEALATFGGEPECPDP